MLLKLKKLFSKIVVIQGTTYYMTNKAYKLYKEETKNVKKQEESFHIIAKYSFDFN